MEIPKNPPKIGKHEQIDKEFGVWWWFLNTWGTASFLLFLACLGTGEYRHTCALISSILLTWSYFFGLSAFPPFINRLRSQSTEAAKTLEKKIFFEHFVKRPFDFLPLLIGCATLGSIAFLPAFYGRWYLYVSILNFKI
ncbi:hypothetical protein [Solimicrobium silvestre]|uniref:Uncharacterized protein n=1 Tax=Solimicrobium silvestre TaxID=2099400 RepID=A0A2S9H361_9BURK|nr:hypothetical protein [Solimicrobium silvestre]PRC94419.1 hypothetical protein S2091_1040 [Solimicrobium silvestre]